MQKINLKKTTKDKLYAMLCELDENYQSLKDETERRVETLNDELIKANVEIAGLRREVETDSVVIKGLRDELDRCVKEIIQSEEHPWRHLWKCLWR